MVENEVEHITKAVETVVLNPVLAETSELTKLLLAQDLRVGMTLSTYEVPRG